MRTVKYTELTPAAKKAIASCRIGQTYESLNPVFRVQKEAIHPAYANTRKPCRTYIALLSAGRAEEWLEVSND